MPSRQRLLVGAIVASLVVTAAVAIGILLFGEFDETEGRILATTAFISIASLLSLPGGVLLDQQRLPALAWTTIGLAVAGFCLATAGLWADDETLGKLAGSVAAAAVAATQTAALAVRRRETDPRAVDRLFAAATGAVVAVAGLVVGAIWAQPDSEAYVRALAALAVANVLLVVLQPVLRRGGGGPAERVRLTFEDGTTAELEVAAADFADAAARAIRRAGRDGKRVQAVERLRS